MKRDEERHDAEVYQSVEGPEGGVEMDSDEREGALLKEEEEIGVMDSITRPP